jgi:ATP-dependent Clp protease ATP-binding subunit ClpC
VYPFERFTEKAKRVLTLAQDEAEKSHHSYINTEHLLLGLLRESDGMAATVLAELGVEIDRVRVSIDSMLGPTERIKVQQIIPTSRVKKVIEIAFEEAQRMKNTYVGTEHLLLGLLIEGEGIAPRVLRELGVNLDKVRHELYPCSKSRVRKSRAQRWRTSSARQSGGEVTSKRSIESPTGWSWRHSPPRREARWS